MYILYMTIHQCYNPVHEMMNDNMEVTLIQWSHCLHSCTSCYEGLTHPCQFAGIDRNGRVLPRPYSSMYC